MTTRPKIARCRCGSYPTMRKMTNHPHAYRAVCSCGKIGDVALGRNDAVAIAKAILAWNRICPPENR